MICDYYLSRANIKRFEDWDKDKKSSLEGRKKENWRNKAEEKKYELWLEEVFEKPLAKIKREEIKKLKGDKDIHDFYPNPADLQNLPEKSTLIKISFNLKKPYLSKDEGKFHLLEWKEKERDKEVIKQKIIENSIVRGKFTGLPMVRPSTWKGHLRFAADRVEWKEGEKKETIKRLFGAESKDEKVLKGRLYFFPTFFKDEAERDVITPLKRDTRTPARGPINLEVMKPDSKGEFYLLYVPYPRGKDFREGQIKEDLKFLAEALKLMFYTYGFSAKKTSGFGVIEGKLNEGKVWMNTSDGTKESDFQNINYIANNINGLLSQGDNHE